VRRARAGGFALTVPDTWFEIDLHPATRDASINDLVRIRTRGVPELSAQRGAIAKLLRETARDAVGGGAVYLGVMVEVVEGAGLSASTMVSVLPSPDGTSEVSNTSAIMATLREKTARSEHDTWRKTAIVELPAAGQAARSFGVEDVEVPGGAGWVRATTMQTFVPVPDSLRVALISCSSPNVVLVDAFHDLFDAVTSTFRFVPDSTSPTAPTAPTAPTGPISTGDPASN
jgi:hypothetical protein